MFSFKKNKKIDTATVCQILMNYRINEGSVADMVERLDIHDDVVELALRVPDDVDVEKMHHELGEQLQAHGVRELNMNVSLYKRIPPTINASSAQTSTKTSDEITKPAPMQSQLAAHPRIRHIIVVASGKGGVGKSTTAVNIALALQKIGKKVGMLDADIYGPSIPDMLGVAGIKPQVEGGKFVPIEAFGMPIMSIGSLLDTNSTPIAWRGIKATGALMQLFNDTDYPPLDYLVIDMPPGTGDIQLTLAQRIPVTGAVIVTTPQHIALLDAQKGIEMFAKTDIAVLGVVENMALHTCSHCGHVEEIFGAGGGERLSVDYQVPLLGKLPIAKQIRESVDKGAPSVAASDEFAEFYVNIAHRIEQNISKFAKTHDEKRIF